MTVPPGSTVLDAPDRLAALDAVGVVEGTSDAMFQPYARLVARLLDVPVALVSFVSPDRQQFAASLGLPSPWDGRHETPIELSLCRHVVATEAVLALPDAAADPRFESHPAIEQLGVRAYLGVPLRAPGGEPLGSLCAIDTAPRPWSDEDVQVLQDLARAVTTAIALRTTAGAQRRTSAAASHRLRTPITALRLGLDELVLSGDRPDDDWFEGARHQLDVLEQVAAELVADTAVGARSAASEVDLVALVSAAGGSLTVAAAAPVTVRIEEAALHRLVQLLVVHGSGSTRAATAQVGVEQGAPRVRFALPGSASEAQARSEDTATLARRLGARIVYRQSHVDLFLAPGSLVS